MRIREEVVGQDRDRGDELLYTVRDANLTERSPGTVADIFISYSRHDSVLVRPLATELEERGVSVWWDPNIRPGDDFNEEIAAELARARAAIVVWTRNSIGSRWVRSEANRADRASKLIQLRTEDLSVDAVPQPFDMLHTGVIGDWASLEAGLAKYGVKLRPRVETSESALPVVPWWRTRRTYLGLSTASALVASGGGWFAWTRPPPRVEWQVLPAGSRLANMTAVPIPSFVEPDRGAARSVQIRSGTLVPAPGIDDPLWRASVGGEGWLRFPIGEAHYAHVPEREVDLRIPR